MKELGWGKILLALAISTVAMCAFTWGSQWLVEVPYEPYGVFGIYASLLDYSQVETRVEGLDQSWMLLVWVVLHLYLAALAYLKIERR